MLTNSLIKGGSTIWPPSELRSPTGVIRRSRENFEQLGPLDTLRSGIRIEAIALAVRTQIALGDKKLARELLKKIWEAPQKSHRLYRYAAIACLEFGEYRRALSLIGNAIELSDADKWTS